MKRSHILIKNISSNFFAQFWLMVISFFTTPIIFKHLGESKFGLLVILNTIPSYLSVLDFGIIAALIKNISELKAKNKNLTNLISNSFLLYILTTAILSIALFFSAEYLSLKILKIPSELISLSVISLKLIALSFFLSSLISFFSTIPQALQRFEIYNLKNLIIGTVLPIGTIILLFLNKNLKEVVYLYIITHAVILFIFIYLAKALLPPLKLKLNLNKKILNKLWSFGKFKFVSNINSRLVFQLNHFFVYHNFVFL